MLKNLKKQLVNTGLRLLKLNVGETKLICDWQPCEEFESGQEEEGKNKDDDCL